MSSPGRDSRALSFWAKSRDSLLALKFGERVTLPPPPAGNCDVDSSGLKKVENGFYCPLSSQGETGVQNKGEGLLPGKVEREQTQGASAGEGDRSEMELTYSSLSSPPPPPPVISSRMILESLWGKR